MMWPFKWKLSACTVTFCYLFFKILQNEICKLGRNLPLATLGSERVNDHFITSHNLISWQGRDIVGRKLMLVTIGTWRVNANFNTFTLNSLNEKYPFRKKMPAILQHKAFSGLPTFSFHNFHVNSAVKSVNNKSTERPNFFFCFFFFANPSTSRVNKLKSRIKWF